MKLALVEEARNMDQLATKLYHIPSLLLMENAGLRVVEAAVAELGGTIRGKRVLVFAGKGNNGGDGFVVARHLANQGAEVKVFLLARLEDYRGDARVNLDILEQMSVKLFQLHEGKDLNLVKIALVYTDLIIDAIFGTGFRGPLLGFIDTLIGMINQSEKPAIAVDIPSGLEADTGRTPGNCTRAARTVTFGVAKPGLYLEPGCHFTGQIMVGDISFPPALLEKLQLKLNVLTVAECRSLLPRRKLGGHKGTYGHAVVVGGSTGLTGAVVLCAQAAMRAGAGLVTAAVPAAVNGILETKLTEIMNLPLPDQGCGYFLAEAWETLAPERDRYDVWAVGPGLGQQPASAEFLQRLLENCTRPLVLDADGLNLLARRPEVLQGYQGRAVLTPHPGEMARLLKITTEDVQRRRLAVAQQAAIVFNAVVVLKGWRTIIASPDGQTFINPTGNPGLATAGSGDVLTGVIAGLLAQGLQPLEAAAAGAFIHGLAGDRAVEQQGMTALIAGDIVATLPQVFRELEPAIQIS